MGNVVARRAFPVSSMLGGLVRKVGSGVLCGILAAGTGDDAWRFLPGTELSRPRFNLSGSWSNSA